MIVTLTVNPSLDRTVELEHALERGEVQRVARNVEEPGGKGVNVTRALVASGAASVAVLPGRADDPLVVALTSAGVPVATVPIAARLRSNITITEPDGVTTKLNELGPDLSEAEQQALIAAVVAQAADASWLVLAGSLPPSIAPDFYVRVVREARAAGVAARIAVDTSGAPLAALVEAGEPVDLIKPNGEELAELAGEPDADALEADPERVAEVAATLVPRGIRSALVTLGSKGAVLVGESQGWFAPAPRIVPRSTVGAGDSSLAGFLLAVTEGAAPERALAQAVAHGAAAASLPGSAVPSRVLADASAITVIRIRGAVAPVIP
ncbi:1-phosphofructokinase [Agromyces flavus]|uniref:1-phosphofructokinase n=1 Tax=Agromyces flavus TaxID=589382 RepID=A0A1H1LFW4_9MICO|nr:1-phosphofructokinase family hexose kinase [Agromyces flavus]MCP2367544.1 1-phosphofructokinase [Agromyces flavus]GGI45518.1 1-phosphofructokinase [Agromyces flavus]SDR72925.1 1-phosphofructokinase [Agromyces flavus]